MNQKREVLYKLIGIIIFTAIVIAQQHLGAILKIGPFSISLVLFPIVLGAVLFGPLAGAWLGFVFGLVVLLSGDADAFMPINRIATIFIVFFKGSMAGFVSGYLYKVICKKSIVLGAVSAAIAGPVVNTAIFLIGDLIFYMPTISAWAMAMGYKSTGSYIVLGLTGGNFLSELMLNLVLSPLILLCIYVYHVKLNKSSQ